MKKLLLSLCCLVLVNCKKNEPQSLNADLVDVRQEDKMMAAKPQNVQMPPPPSKEEE